MPFSQKKEGLLFFTPFIQQPHLKEREARERFFKKDKEKGRKHHQKQCSPPPCFLFFDQKGSVSLFKVYYNVCFIKRQCLSKHSMENACTEKTAQHFLSVKKYKKPKR